MSIEQIVERLNNTRVHRVLSVVPGADGRQTLAMPAENTLVVGFESSRHEASVRWSMEGLQLIVDVKTQGMHFTPQPWPPEEPLDLKAILAVQAEQIVAPENLGDTASFSVQLPPGLEHIIQHNMGSTKFVESVVSIDGGERQFAMVQTIDDNNFKLTLTEPLAVQLSAIFVKDG